MAQYKKNIQNKNRLSPYSLKYLSDIYEINFYKLKKNLKARTFDNLVEIACDFNKNFIIVSQEKEKEKAKIFNYIKIIKQKINSIKLILNDIFLNIALHLNFKCFYNKYFIDFRGRNIL